MNLIPKKNKAVLFLGAGFSKSAGIPLVQELFDEIPYAPGNSVVLKNIYEKVSNEWQNCKDLGVETWMKQKYLISHDGDEIVSYEDIVDFILARVVAIPEKYGKNGAYYYGISTSIQNETHKAFWNIIQGRFDIGAIITTNYDIVIEQGLRKTYSTSSNNRDAPSCIYGGFPTSFEQRIRIITNVATGRNPSSFREAALAGIELYKLHGSVNWVEEPHGFKIHDDVRAVFRTKRSLGKPRIIPPCEEKDRPAWAHYVWEYAQKRLAEADVWFVCGYSLPEYDKEILHMISSVSSLKESLILYISDPKSKQVMKRFQKILRCKSKIITLHGLPDALQQLK